MGWGRSASVMTAMGSRRLSVQGSRIDFRWGSVDSQKVAENTADLDGILDYGDDLHLAAALGAERVHFMRFQYSFHRRKARLATGPSAFRYFPVATAVSLMSAMIRHSALVSSGSLVT